MGNKVVGASGVGSTAAGASGVGSKAAGALGVGSTAAGASGVGSKAAGASGVGSTAAGALVAGVGSSLEGEDPEVRKIIRSCNIAYITQQYSRTHSCTEKHTHLPLLRRQLLVWRWRCWLHGWSMGRRGGMVWGRLLGCRGAGLRGCLLCRTGLVSWRCLLLVGGFTVALVYILRDVSTLYIVNHCYPLPVGEECTT